MSRFNNPQAQPPVRSPFGSAAQGQHSPLDQDPQAWPQTGGRPAERPAQQLAPQQGFGTRQAQPGPYAQPQQPVYTQPSGYSQPGYSEPPTLDPFAALRADPVHDAYQYSQQHGAFSGGQYALPQQPALSTYQPRSPQPPPFDPFAQPAQAYAPPGAYTPAHGASFDAPPSFDNWSATQPHADTHDYGAGFGGTPAPAYDSYQQQAPRTAPPAGGSSHWVGQDHYAQLGMEPTFDDAAAYEQPAQPQTPGAFEQTYAEDEANYSDEAPRRGWTRVAVLLASTIVLGGGLAYAYSALLGGPSGTPPVVKSAEGPFKVKPSDPGGKQFAHTDSKVMGRLGDGSASPTETSSTSTSSSSSDVDAGGARKVPVLVVSRDGTIQPPAAPSDAPSPQQAAVSVPGLTVVDAFGGQRPRPQPQPSTVSTAASEPPQRPLVVSPPAAPVKPKVIAAAAPTTMNDSSPAEAEPAAPPKKAAPKKTAAVAPPVATGPAPTGAGYVAVLASVPASASSRIDALKQFADMQQKYGTILQNKTPDVQEANLGEKGTYHRLLVGPPGSRDSANQLCSELKSQGYTNCWVTAY